MLIFFFPSRLCYNSLESLSAHIKYKLTSSPARKIDLLFNIMQIVVSWFLNDSFRREHKSTHQTEQKEISLPPLTVFPFTSPFSGGNFHNTNFFCTIQCQVLYTFFYRIIMHLLTMHHYILMCCYAYIYLHITQNDSIYSETCVPRVTIHLGHGSLSVGKSFFIFFWL